MASGDFLDCCDSPSRFDTSIMYFSQHQGSKSVLEFHLLRLGFREFWQGLNVRSLVMVAALLPQPQRNKKMEHVSLTSWHHRPNASAPATEKQENGACITHVMTPPPKRFCPSHRETRKWSMYHSRHDTTAQTLLPQPQRNKKMEHVSLTS
ncbi:hypothetical protein RRG08_037198 [Elysia crispata]|uniref:Uncharacterized protein n=1 Tax=Elysia crispata TaxID=231223 RepID=A0AAE0Z4Q9_9GAST|nr:hypothetical protein RRG08_037198 [Elysia crispata]